MSLTTLLLYFGGDATAIVVIAGNPWSGVLGLLFVLSTGLARHYDTHDLRAEPWHVFVPLAVSLLLSALLYAVLYLLVASQTSIWLPLLSGWWCMIGLMWLTAPLAWLYAIPYQRWLSAEASVRAKLVTLGIVSLWRVLLMGRAVSLLFPATPWSGYALVLLVADSAALAGMAVTRPAAAPSSTPRIILGMATIGPSQPDQAAGLTCLISALGIVTLPLWLIGALTGKAATDTWLWNDAGPPAAPPDLPLWLLAVLALLLFVSVLFYTQPAQRRRSHIEALFKEGKVRQALAELSSQTPDAFPPQWQAPPACHFREPPALLDVIETVAWVQCAPWVRSVYLERFRRFLSDPYWYWFYDADLERIAALLKRLPEGPELARLIRTTMTDERQKMLEEITGRPQGPDGEIDDSLPSDLQPAPVPTGRRQETIALLWQLAEKAMERPDGPQ